MKRSKSGYAERMAPLDSMILAELHDVTAIRHDLHRHPELGYQERRTSTVVQQELEAAGVQFVAGLAGGTGVLGFLPATGRSAEGTRTIALRADMDALPIHEETELSYSSEHPGIMHACGHDGHTAVLIGAARVLAKSERPNDVLFLFQPAEEGGAGGAKMCEDGVLHGRVLGRPADLVFGLHGSPQYRVGELGTRVGPMMASADGFSIRVRGAGGHAAMPHTGVDPVLVAAQIITGLQTIASRNADPLDSIVVTVAVLRAGSAHNVIPDEVMMEGTLRALRAETRDLGQRRIREVVEGIAGAHGATASVSFLHGYPMTVNDGRATNAFLEALGDEFEGKITTDIPPVMGAEDFSFYGHHVPACFYWLGLLREGQEHYPNLHAPEFDFNDEALPYGMKAMCRLALSACLPSPA
jgi:amidohydrolase